MAFYPEFTNGVVSPEASLSGSLEYTQFLSNNLQHTREAYNFVMNHPHPEELYKAFYLNPLMLNQYARSHSVSINDTALGDSGKGSGAAKYNRMLKELGLQVVSFGLNGGANAGHRFMIDGTPAALHQLPAAIVEQGAIAAVLKGQVLHMGDLFDELNQVQQAFGAVPGELLIDSRTILSMDTHRAMEQRDRAFTHGSGGSTLRGIGPTYEMWLGRKDLKVEDLLNDNWEKDFRQHYDYVKKNLQGYGKKWKLSDVQVSQLDTSQSMTHAVGNENEFIARLGVQREQIRPYVVNNMPDLIFDWWHNPKQVGVSLEWKQGPGLDPIHGVRRDTTGSRPLTRFVVDSTYGIIKPEQIELPVGFTKTLWMSSAGERRLPTLMNPEFADEIRNDQGQFGGTTGRPYGIYELPLPFLQYLRDVDGYDYLAATHMDAAKPDRKYSVVTHYVSKDTREIKPYLPDQDYLDGLEVGGVLEFDGWDGASIEHETDPSKLPPEAQRYLAFLGMTLAPPVLATTQADVGDYMSFAKGWGD